ncbi:hypothetical protein Tco_0645784 [Tanacetum coccineum]
MEEEAGSGISRRWWRKPQYVDHMKSLPRLLPPAAIVEPTKDDNTEGLTDGGVIIFERQESQRKWGCDNFDKNDMIMELDINDLGANCQILNLIQAWKMSHGIASKFFL